MRKVLQDIFNQRERSARIFVIKPDFPLELQKMLHHHRCLTPVEPALIGMAASSTGPNLTLLLTGNEGIRSRGLHQRGVQKDMRRFFRDKLKKSFSVVLATAVGLPNRNEQVMELHTRIFEDQVRSILQQKIFEKYAIMPCFRRRTPGQVERHHDIGDRQAGEVDGYLYLEREAVLEVWICECELREEGNEFSLTIEEKMSKLARKVEGARAFERSSSSRQVNVKGYLITNAVGMSPDAEALAHINNLQFVHTTMPAGWTENIHWQLKATDVQKIDL